jgi:RNA polymerase-binding transcription factor DksA
MATKSKAKSSPKKNSPARKAKPIGKSAVKPTSKPSAKSTPTAKTAKAAKPTPSPKGPARPPARSPAPPGKGAPSAKGAPEPKATAVAKTPAKAGARPTPAKEGTARASLRSSILAKSRAKIARPIAFSFDEVRAIAAIAESGAKIVAKPAPGAAAEAAVKAAVAAKLARPSQPNHVKAASLADILGFNPRKTGTPQPDDDSVVPEKYRRFHKALMDLRRHLTGQLDQHTEDTLKRSSKDDAGDLSSYGQHMADAGTDTFDRDFALSMVANEQEALSEVEAAIQRIKAGTYGVCESTGKPIAKDRLMAVPFTRYSAEALKLIEKNRLRSRSQAGLFGELGEEVGKMAEDDGGGDE